MIVRISVLMFMFVPMLAFMFMTRPMRLLRLMFGFSYLLWVPLEIG